MSDRSPRTDLGILRGRDRVALGIIAGASMLAIAADFFWRDGLYAGFLLGLVAGVSAAMVVVR